MASVEAVHSIYTRFVDKNYSESGENICAKCCILKDHLELLINEPKIFPTDNQRSFKKK